MNPLEDPAADLELRITIEDMRTLKAAFKDNKPLFKVMLKIFLPTAADPDMPVEYREDLWNKIDFSNMRIEDCKAVIVARHDLINWVRDCLVLIKQIAQSEELSVEEMAKAAKKNSAK